MSKPTTTRRTPRPNPKGESPASGSAMARTVVPLFQQAHAASKRLLSLEEINAEVARLRGRE